MRSISYASRVSVLCSANAAVALLVLASLVAACQSGKRLTADGGDNRDRRADLSGSGGGNGSAGSGGDNGGAGGGTGGDMTDADGGADAPVTPTCPTGQHSCAGTCVGDSDPRTCGTSCTPCEPVP